MRIERFTGRVIDTFVNYVKGKYGKTFPFYAVRVITQDEDYVDIKISSEQSNELNRGVCAVFECSYECKKLWQNREGQLRCIPNIRLDSYEITDAHVADPACEGVTLQDVNNSPIDEDAMRAFLEFMRERSNKNVN